MSSKAGLAEVYAPPFSSELYYMVARVGESAVIISGLALAVYGLTKAIGQLRESHNERSFRKSVERQNNQQSEQDLKTLNQILDATATSQEVKHDSTAHIGLSINTKQARPPSSEL